MGRASLGRLAALAGPVAVAWSIHHVFLVGTCESNPPPGVKECPPETVVHDVVLLAGIALCVVGLAAGRGGFFGLFGGIGVGSLTAGLRAPEAGGQRWYVLFGLLFLGAPLLGPLLLSAGGVRSRRRLRRLWDEGVPATATVLSVAATGATLNDDPRVRLRVLVEPAAGAPYESEVVRLVPRLAVPREGDRLAIVVDPRDPHAWAIAARP